ncbi:MAG TPA: hypothetical protein VFL47_11020, partial [Flavisolibacter sp.]|nr:hypothetical protein [Flavisolibacter sp.]
SVRAYFYFNLTKDSAYLKKFFRRGSASQPKKDTVKTTKSTATRFAALQHKPVAPDSQQLGYLHRDELWDEQLLAKKRRTLA